MTCRFLHTEQPDDYAALTSSQQAQLEVVSQGYDGGRVPASERLRDTGDEETSFLGFIDYCELGDGTATYDLWLYNVDSGRLFEHGTTNALARVIQGSFQFEVRDTEALATSLTEAIEALRAEAPRSLSNPLPRLPRS